MVGDLALAGLPLIGLYRSVRGGHKLNHAVLTALMADRTPGGWSRREPCRRRRSRVRVARRLAAWSAGMVAPAYRAGRCPEPRLTAPGHLPFH